MKITTVSIIAGKSFVYAGHLTSEQVRGTASRLVDTHYGHCAYCACVKCDKDESATFYVNFSHKRDPPLNDDGTVERASQVIELWFTHSETLEPIVVKPVGDPVTIIQWDETDTCDVITTGKHTSPREPLMLPRKCTDCELIDFLRAQFDSDDCVSNWSVQDILRGLTTAQVVWVNHGQKSVTSIIWI